MVVAKRAAVKPRVFGPDGNDALPLEDRVKRLLEAQECGIVLVVGRDGSGKTTALQHLAAVLPADAPVCLLDEGEEPAIEPDRHTLVVHATGSPAASGGHSFATYQLASWGDDDLIEYLLAVHPDHCASVLERFPARDRAALGGVPELCVIVLDTLAREPSLGSGHAALGLHLQRLCPDAALLRQARLFCLDALLEGGLRILRPEVRQGNPTLAPAAERLLRHDCMRVWLAADQLAEDLRTGAAGDYLAIRLPRVLIKTAGAMIANDPDAIRRLSDWMEGYAWNHAMVASLRVAADPAWVPATGEAFSLAGAYLDGACWRGVQMPGVKLRETDLNDADLREANLEQVNLGRATLRGACLAGASLMLLKAVQADFAGADLSRAVGQLVLWDTANFEGCKLRDAVLIGASFRGCNLQGAVFSRANLSQARFNRAQLDGADFTGANLEEANLSKLCLRQAEFTGARFSQATLRGCDMEGMHLPGADFSEADLREALLTGALLTRADFRRASLRQARLGAVNMEFACLRNADLSRATFHMGSSRSGLLITPIASEGSRTGFYTDDADEQSFKAPEEIRKANLRGADLRGANIQGTDFYLVDLRDALYDAEQEAYFRRCRAIL